MTLTLTEVDGVIIQPRHQASCHCGAVQFELQLPVGLVDVRRCDCSLCRRRGAIVASVPLAAIRILRGADSLRLYQFNTKTAKHYFCGHCGIYTHHQRRSNPQQYGFNVACLEGINPLKISNIPTYNGVEHPADQVK
ncbi:GFA family protein [Shewanella sp. GXUN23E]|uniref:GFA family protein n=1 Tax=Shewanella sp. GXUN23E TaxID=3422498 RepID=UPI003D7CA286